MMNFLRRISILAALALMLIQGQAADGVPRVLILGDSIYRQPVADLQKELKGKVEIHFPQLEPGEVRHTAAALKKLNQWLGEGQWDVIHFNFGLGDLIHRAPGMKSFRVLPLHVGGIRTTPPAQYEANLDQLAKRLKATKADIIWANTTPIRHSTTQVFAKGSETEYNAIAARIMKRHGIAIHDMNAFIRGLIDMDKPAGHGADPFHFDRKPIHPPLRALLVRHLGLKLAGPVNP